MLDSCTGCMWSVGHIRAVYQVARVVLLLQVMLHMSKCFQAIGKLKLDNEAPGPGQRPKALGMISCVGEEYVPFKSPLPLKDKVR